MVTIARNSIKRAQTIKISYKNFLLPFYNLDFYFVAIYSNKKEIVLYLQSKDFHSKSIMLTLHMDSLTIYLSILGPHTRGGPSKQPKHVLCICQRTCKAHVHVNAHVLEKKTHMQSSQPIETSLESRATSLAIWVTGLVVLFGSSNWPVTPSTAHLFSLHFHPGHFRQTHHPRS